MPPQRTVKFRPSIVLFVGECGERIHEHFVRFCAGLDEPLHAGIACIQVDENGANARRVLVTAHDTRFQDEQWRKVRDVFAEALEENGVQGERTLDGIAGAGYDIENANTQVIVAGHTGKRATATVQLASVAEQIRALLVGEEVPTQIYYVLSDYRAYNQTTPINDTMPPPWADNLYGGGDFPQVTFCFIYQKKGRNQQTFNSEETVEYAAAEAIFGLIATSVVGVPSLREALQTSPRVIDITDRIGSLGTSLIRFPRAEAGEYCSQRLAADLLKHWTIGLGRNITDEKRRRQQAAAMQFERRLRHWAVGARTGDQGWTESRLWAFRLDHEWPHIKHLSPEGREKMRRYEMSSAKLFEPLRTPEIERAEASRTGADAWSEAVKIAAGRTGDYFPAWQSSARRAWTQAEHEIETKLDTTVDALWLDKQGSWEEANAYVAQLSESLVQTKEQLVALRQFHERRYRRELARLLRMAPPVRDDTGGSISGTEDTVVTGLIRPEARGTPLGDDSLPPPLPSQKHNGVPPGAGTPLQPEPAASASQEKDPLDDDLRRARRAVERRIAYQQKRVPAVSALVGAGLIADPPLALLVLDLLPTVWRTSFTLACAVFVGVGLLLLLASWMYRSWALRQLDEAELALVACYRNLYRCRCDRYEDNLRAELTMELHWRVQAKSDFLRDLPQQIHKQQKQLQEDAAETEHKLFKGPGGARDVLIGNGEWLRSSLVPVYDVLRREQTRNPVVGWHTTFEQINDQLLETFRVSARSVIGGGTEEFKDSIVAFTRTIVEPYLGRSANIGAALSALGGASQEIWDAALVRSKPLFSGDGGIMEERILCGRETELHAVAALHRGRSNTLVPTKDVERNREWLLVAQFIQGGVRTKWPPRYRPIRAASGSASSPVDFDGDEDEYAYDETANSSPGATPAGLAAGLDAVFQHEPDIGAFPMPPEPAEPAMGADNHEMPPGGSLDEFGYETPPRSRPNPHGDDESPPGTGMTGNDSETPPRSGRFPDAWPTAADNDSLPPGPASYSADDSTSWAEPSRSGGLPPGMGTLSSERSSSDDDGDGDDDDDDDESDQPLL